MKKMYISLFLNLTTTLTFCMEQQRSWSYDESATEYPLIVFNPTPLNKQSVYTNEHPNILNNQQAYNPIADTNWPIYNKIMDIPYKRDKPATRVTNPEELTPIYLPITYKERTASTKESMAQAEKKSLLRTTLSLQPNNTELIKQIYEATHTFIENVQERGQFKSVDLYSLIHTINNARDNGINEDIMGKFSYTQQPSEDLRNKINKIIYDKKTPYGQTEICTTLFFSGLKHYTLTVKNTGEVLPFETKSPSFCNIFEISPNASKKCDFYNLWEAFVNLPIFKEKPAFMYLEYVIRNLLQYLSTTTLKQLAWCLYANQKSIIKPCSEKPYTNLKNEFYAKAYVTLQKTGTSEDCYAVLTLIDAAKKFKDINNEKDLGYKIFNFEPTNFYEYFNKDYSTNEVKNRIALFCLLIEKYNNTRLKKITPTFVQHQAYALYKDLNLALPDSCNCIQLKKKHYAFREFKELIENTKVLISAIDQNIQEEVERHYPLKK